jgi:serine/threonine-protein kinase
VIGEPPGPPRRDRRWLWLGAAALGALLIVGAILLLTGTEKRTVPNVVGSTLTSANEKLDAAGFKTDVRRRADSAPSDTVIDQIPRGVEADKGSVVTLIVSNGPTTVKVPDVIGISETDAKRRIKGADLRAQIERESSTKVPDGTVIRTDPGPGRLTERNSSVTLFVSSGPSESVVPNVVGEDQESAVARIRAEGLSAIVRERASSEQLDTVVDQTPAAGQRVDEGSSVTIFVSDNTVREVPDVTGLTQDDAESELRDAGFAVGVRTRSTDQPDEDGIVLSQSPGGGAERRERATVTITVGALATPEGTPTP